MEGGQVVEVSDGTVRRLQYSMQCWMETCEGCIKPSYS